MKTPSNGTEPIHQPSNKNLMDTTNSSSFNCSITSKTPIMDKILIINSQSQRNKFNNSNRTPKDRTRIHMLNLSITRQFSVSGMSNTVNALMSAARLLMAKKSSTSTDVSTSLTTKLTRELLLATTHQVASSNLTMVATSPIRSTMRRSTMVRIMATTFIKIKRRSTQSTRLRCAETLICTDSVTIQAVLLPTQNKS